MDTLYEAFSDVYSRRPWRIAPRHLAVRRGTRLPPLGARGKLLCGITGALTQTNALRLGRIWPERTCLHCLRRAAELNYPIGRPKPSLRADVIARDHAEDELYPSIALTFPERVWFYQAGIWEGGVQVWTSTAHFPTRAEALAEAVARQHQLELERAGNSPK